MFANRVKLCEKDAFGGRLVIFIFIRARSIIIYRKKIGGNVLMLGQGLKGV